MYNFIDTTDYQTVTSALSSEALSLDGEYIEDHVPGYKTIAVSGRESLSYEFTDDSKATGIDGKEYYGKNLPERILNIKFILKGSTAVEFISRYRTLKKYCSGINRKIRFADEPNAHYIGTLKEIEQPESGLLFVQGIMSFYCADPYLYSDEITSVTASVNSSGILTAHVDNDGSLPVYPTYRIKHSAENGYIGIVQTNGALEIGNIEEADKEAYTKSEMLLNGLSQFADYTGTNPQNPDLPLNGKLIIENNFATIDNGGSGSGWHGGCFRGTLPADSNGEVGAKNFYLWWESKFMTGLMGQTGFQQVLLSDENDAFIAGFGIIKPDSSGNTAQVMFWLPEYGDYKHIDITPSIYDENAFNGRGYEDILKEGSKIRFYYYGSSFWVDVPSIAEKKVKYVYVIIGHLGTLTNHISINQIGDISATKTMVGKWKDIPNRYPASSEVVINTEQDLITVNGIPRNDELVTGSKFSSIPVGSTDIEFYTSSWCTTKPTITVEYNKRWL